MNLIKIFLMCLCLMFSNQYATPILNLKNEVLNKLAVDHGTDKGSEIVTNMSNGHDYAKKYDFYFNPHRNKPLKFLEIGFAYGKSARMWQDYFPQAQLYFIDFNPEFLQKYSQGLSNRCHLFVANQESESDLQNFIDKAGTSFDIILDDGGHSMKQQLTTFNMLFPHVKKGGVYIIEDLHTSYWQKQDGVNYGGHGTKEKPLAQEGSTIYFLQQLVHDINYVGARTGSASEKYCSSAILDELSYYQEHIEAIHFYPSLCFIFKK